MYSTRRGFVMGTLGAAAMVPLHARARTGGIEIRQTAGSDKFKKLPSLSWRLEGESAAPEITLDPTIAFQEILGFGAAFTEASAYLINRMGRGARERFLHELFSPSELGINVTRICIGAARQSRSVRAGLAVESARLDEERRIDAGRKYQARQLGSLCQVSRQVHRGISRRRHSSGCDYQPERGRYGSGQPNARERPVARE